MVRNGHLPTEQEVLLTPAEVASLFRVDPKTVTRWAKAGKLTSIEPWADTEDTKIQRLRRYLIKFQITKQ